MLLFLIFIHFLLITLHLFLAALQKWRLERGWDPNNASRRVVNSSACERIIVLNKRDLVPEWGLEVKFGAHHRTQQTFNPR